MPGILVFSAISALRPDSVMGFDAQEEDHDRNSRCAACGFNPSHCSAIPVSLQSQTEKQEKGRNQKYANRTELLFVPLTVTLELEWVLRAAYGFAKEEVLATLFGLLETRELEFQDEASIERSIYLYRSGYARSISS